MLLLVLVIGIGNSFLDDGKFQCGFENDDNNGEVDMFNILILFIVFEVEVIYLVIIFYGMVFVVIVILLVMVMEIFGEII